MFNLYIIKHTLNMKQYRLEKPGLQNIDFQSLLNKLLQSGGTFAEILHASSYPKYYYWDKIKHKSIYSSVLSREELWSLVKFLRASQSIKTVIKSENGGHFSWIKFPDYEKQVHDLDQNTGGRLLTGKSSIDRQDRYKYISKGIMEEAIASSQLEGANTTRNLAKKFLKEGRKPKNKSEQMILNTYRTMVNIEEEFSQREMSLDLLLELHTGITLNTLPQREQGRFRKDSDKIVVSDQSNGLVYHIPPRIDFVKTEIENLILFANDQLHAEFIHPIPKAIILHFWLGYLHPFTDGNGRLARAIFYWYLLKHGYWAISYLPISKRIRMSSAQYKKAYIYSEQDDLDLTYFIHYNLNRMILAKNDFIEYIETKSRENYKINTNLALNYGFNDRQIELLKYFYVNPGQKTTSTIHCNTHRISRATSITDLNSLSKFGFLNQHAQGKRMIYTPTDKIKELFK